MKCVPYGLLWIYHYVYQLSDAVLTNDVWFSHFLRKYLSQHIDIFANAGSFECETNYVAIYIII